MLFWGWGEMEQVLRHECLVVLGVLVSKDVERREELPDFFV